MPERLFVPGWAARAAVYRPAVPVGWEVLEPPSFRAAGGALGEYVEWLLTELRSREPVVLGGHSMGGALAVMAAAAEPERVTRLVLVAPCGFPITKSVAAGVWDLSGHVVRGHLRISDLAVGTGRILAAPRAARWLAEEVRGLDLSRQMAQVRQAGIPTTVIACATDTQITTDHCKRAARLLGADYRELHLEGGHLWMLEDPLALARELEATLPA